MATDAFSDDLSGDTSRSRFSYFSDDEPEEGGVRSVADQTGPSRKSGISPQTPAPGSRTSSTGTPGPEEKRLDVSELARTLGMHYTHKFAFPPGAIADLEAVSPVTGQITLTNTGAILLLQGRAKTVLRLEDSRTLEPLDEEIEAELEEEFELISKTGAFNREEMQAVDDDEPAAVMEGNILNLAELLRQNLLLAAPLQPVSDEAVPLGAFVYRGSGDDGDGGQEMANSSNPLRRLGELLQAKNNE